MDQAATIINTDWDDTYRGYVSAQALSEEMREKRRAALDEERRTGSPQTYVYEADGKVLGVLTFGRCGDADRPDSFEIWRLYIAPEAQGQGIGRALLQYGEEQARRGGYEEAVIWAFRENTRACEFYRRHGYEPEKEHWLDEPFCALGVRFYKKLNGQMGEYEMNIRLAEAHDYENIYRLVKTAFETAQVSDGTEQDFVLKLRAGENYIPELEFVAEDETGFIGHVMMTRQAVQTEEGIFEGVLVAPLCVKLENRSRGIGGALLAHAAAKARALGYTAAFLVGNPLYYGRFGYRRTSDFGIQNKTEIPDEVVLACELEPGALEHIFGEIRVV